LSCQRNVLVDKRTRLIVNAEMFVANGTAERDVALVMRSFCLRFGGIGLVLGTPRITAPRTATMMSLSPTEQAGSRALRMSDA
jgi:hypothetical protein